jgi:crotonobetainyl-CoA:carnitine CoA-transferase CaiB-like acyl-CoA transferase
MVSPGALADVKVLDVASMMAGPYCATLLGDMGADVIKVEPPNGDETRRIGPRRGSDSGVFVGVNRNKRSVIADLRTDEGQLVLDRLLRWADIVVDNLRPSARSKLGLDYESVSARNPMAICVSVSTFGSSGPYAGRAGIDPVAQALTGFMNVTGPAGGDPVKAGPPIGDAVCSMLAAFGAVTALHSRARTGRGQQVDVALIDGLVHVQAPYTGQYFLLGDQQPRTGNSIDWYAPYNAYRCADGRYVHLACYNDKFFANLCVALGSPALATDERYRTNEDRLANRAQLDEVIAAFVGARARADVLDVLWAHDVIVGPVNDYAEAFADPQLLHNAMVVEVEHHSGPLRVTGVPLHLSDTPGSVRRPPPALGEHTAEVLRELGIDAALLDSAQGSTS